MRKPKDSWVAREIRKGYLEAHLKEVEAAIERWSRELNAPPLSTEGWQVSPKVSTGETDQEVKTRRTIKKEEKRYIIHAHLKANSHRQLWINHSAWQAKCQESSELVQPAVQAGQELVENSYAAFRENWSDPETGTNDFLLSALDWAFSVLCGGAGPDPQDYNRLPDGRLWCLNRATAHGVAERPQRDKKARRAKKQPAHTEDAVVEAHQRLIKELGELEETKAAVEAWLRAKELEAAMKRLIAKALASHDILVSCRFCKSLWK